MCETIDHEAIIEAEAYWRKGNEPAGMARTFDIEAAPCKCGAKWFVKPKKWSTGWVEADKVEQPALLSD